MSISESQTGRIVPGNDAPADVDQSTNYDCWVQAAQQAWAPPERPSVSETPAAGGTDSSIASAAGVLLLPVSPFGSTALAFAAQVYEEDARS